MTGRAIRVCFVCLGNICRSPTAEGVMAHILERAGLADRIHIDSAGTGSWHVGEPPDRRSASAAKRRGIVLEGAARRVTEADFSKFDYLIAMDADNRDALLDIARTEAHRSKVHLLRSFEPGIHRDADVPDPYYGGTDGFDRVLDICERACEGFLAHLRERHGLP